MATDTAIDNTKPGVVFVAGAWHVPAHFETQLTALKEAGYEAYAPRLPTMGSAGATWKDDAAAVQAAVEARMDAGKEFVVVAHSYGGVPGCGALRGYTVAERAAEGRRGGFRGILFIAAYVVPEPVDNMFTAIVQSGGKVPDWIVTEPLGTPNATSFVTPAARHGCYNDLSDAEADKYFSLLERQSQVAYEIPIDWVVTDSGVPHTFLVCENDQAMPLAVQNYFITNTPTLKVERCNAGHSPFISQPQTVIDIVSRM